MAQFRSRRSLLSEGVACIQGTSPSFALSHDRAGTGSVQVLRPPPYDPDGHTTGEGHAAPTLEHGLFGIMLNNMSHNFLRQTITLCGSSSANIAEEPA
jgi:hypothetical protein